MANPRALDKRRKSVRNIRKITRTMELIATARFKHAMDRAAAATDYTDRITQLVADLANTGLDLSHPLLEAHEENNNATLLVLTSNRGLCGGYNGNVLRQAAERRRELDVEFPNLNIEVSGKRGVSNFRYRGFPVERSYTHFEDKPTFAEVEVLANRFLEDYTLGKLDRLDVAYTKFLSHARQRAVVETLLPLGALDASPEKQAGEVQGTQYEFLPSAESILQEVVPTSFKVKLFKCFLDAAVSEQIARMIAMKSATENASDLIRHLSQQYNRARQSKITGELLEVMGGVEAMKK